MNRNSIYSVIAVAAMAGAGCTPAESPDAGNSDVASETPGSADAGPIKVDRSNYQDAEVARNFTKWAANGANNKLMHMTEVTPSGPAPCE